MAFGRFRISIILRLRPCRRPPWLARWLLVARFLAFLRPDLRFMVPMGVIWHAWCLYFGVLEVPGTILGRSWDDPGTLEGTRKGPVRSRLGFYRFFSDFGDPF